jgi:Fe2+ or Zn2+ uptake regulation protein
MTRRSDERTDPAADLAARGLRATRQRVAVLDQLRGGPGHPTAAELHRRLLSGQPNLSLKTVYDVLESLVGVGLAGCVTDGGAPYRYEANTLPHYHAQCRICGALVDVPARADGHIRGRTALPEGFEVEEIRVTLVGYCSRCRNHL